jgi:type I restriction enzyme S subunit
VSTTTGWPSLPPSWQVRKLKRVASLRAGEAITSDAISEQGDYPVFGGNGIRGYTSSYTHDGTSVLIGRQGALCGNINLATGRFWASEHAVVGVPLDNADVRWLGALLQSMNLNQYSQSAAQPGISVELVGRLDIPVPPRAAQRQIADYLDRETARMDALMAAKRRMVDLLDERDHAELSRVVIPARCVMAHLRFFARIQGGITVDAKREPGPDGVTRPYLRVANVQAGRLDLTEVTQITVAAALAARATLRASDVLMTEGGDIDKLGRGTVWEGQLPECLHQNHIFAVRPDPRCLDSHYLALVTQSGHARAYFESTGVQSTNLASTSSSKILDLPIPVLPLEVQRGIVTTWKRRSARTGRMRSALAGQVELLQEHRQALITAAVTGQLDTPEAA